MPIEFSCPHCGLQTRVADKYAGKTGACSRCRQKVTVPQLGASAPADPLAPLDPLASADPLATSDPLGSPNPLGAADPLGVAGFAPPATPPFPAANYPAASYPPAGFAPPGVAPAGVAPAGYGGAPAKSSGRKWLWVLAGVAGLFFMLCVVGGALLIFPAISDARMAARRTQSGNNLKLIGLAMNNYHDVYNSFPLAGSDEPAYGVNMSWRVRLLPFLEQQAMSDQIDYKKPWNEGSNAQFNDKMPRVYQSPAVPGSKSNTVYVVLADSYREWTPGMPPPTERRKEPYRPVFSHDGHSVGMRSISDGTSNTLLVVEADADQAVPWMAPKDIVFDPKQPRRGLGKAYGNTIPAVFADGSIHNLNSQIDDQVLRNLVHRDDGNPIIGLK